MKKTLFSIILAGLSTTLYVSAAEKPCKKTPQEIFAKYSTKAEEEYFRLKNIERDGLLDNPSFAADKQKKAFIDQTRREWAERDNDWKKQESDVLLRREGNKSREDILKSQREILNNTQKAITCLSSWSPKILYRRLLDNANYQKELSTLHQIYESTQKIYAKQLHQKTMKEYGEEQKLFDKSNVPSYMQALPSIIKKSKSPLLEEKSTKELINFSKTCFKHENHLYAFARSSGLSKRDQQLFHEYRQQQLKE